MQHILWSNLVASPRNVRKVKAGIETLAASIAADGLIHNLAVTARDDGKYEVIAGERRRRAIVQLVRAGTWDRSTVIPCEVCQDADATAISYAENAQRVAMHPADAVRAFASLAAEGHDEAAIAHRYGYDRREVRRMLALAAVSPKVINALAADKIDVATAQAFTLTDDHKRQEQVLRRARSVHEVRAMLTNTKLTTGHRLFRFVGSEDYLAAGGTLTRDLFDARGDGYADDPALVQQLVSDALDEASETAKADGWSEVVATEQTYHDATNRWHRLYPDVEGGYSEEAKAKGIAVLTIDHYGQLTATAYTRAAQRTGKRDATCTPLPRATYDARMIEDLSRVRTAALQSEVASKPQIAFAVLLDTLLPMAMGDGTTAGAVQLRGGSVRASVKTSDISTKQITSPFDSVADLITAMPPHLYDRLQWLISLDRQSTDALLAACTGALIDATQGKHIDRARALSADRIARAVDLDMTQHWAPTPAFFARLGKKALLSGLTEACGAPAAENCAKLKRGELALACADRIPGHGWLAPALRIPEDEPETHEGHEFDRTGDFDQTEQVDHDGGMDECDTDYDPANDDADMLIAAE